ncbi:hypothetical protein CDD82_3662 [Ophiocordyceps australis]|uniref:FAD-binding PCMH-type domain-containing protein n=1 Tax=Ophiocordyceps australis TaxID=1399860 RepID=A0A2C5Z5J5_9HYPO|nr:hypothetical protein CDD82_3662 [Ophiocordyceps australis]
MLGLGRFLILAAASLACAARDFDRAHPSHKCRCRPHQPCWPSRDAWQALNSSIDGNLVAVQPAAHTCHEPNYSAAACNAALNRSTDSLWRASEPGALQWVNWESWPQQNQSCYFDTARTVPCRHGRLSPWSAVVHKTEHIQAAVRFATKYNIRLAIKNSGHCFLGRSAAPESLQIATNRLKDITFDSTFVPAGANYSHHGAVSAVTVGAGVSLKELYTAAGSRNMTLVAGLAHTVALAGGYIQGGGHSPLGTWKGMASDNALQFLVVNAKGNLIIANDYQNTSLFWALRGGGGGTFGVVVSVTIKTFSNVPAPYAFFNFAAPRNDAAWKMVNGLNTHLPAISDVGGSGYFFIRTKATDKNDTQHVYLSGALIFANQSRVDEAKRVMDTMAADVGQYSFPWSTSNISMATRVSDWILGVLPGPSDETGGKALLASRLISRDFLASSHGPGRLTSAIQSIFRQADDINFDGLLVGGGEVNTNRVNSALNPAWRKTLLHVVFGMNWNSSMTLAEQKKLQSLVTGTLVEELKALEPHTGAYLNEANAYETWWQESFWGSNYPRLYQIKHQVDPDGVFIVRRGVGSEDWGWGHGGFCRRASR